MIKKRVGFKEYISLGIDGDDFIITATIDTGNGGVVPTLSVEELSIENDDVTFMFFGFRYKFKINGNIIARVGNEKDIRPIIQIDYIIIKGRKIKEPFIAVTMNRHKSTQALINRKTISELNLLVDANKNNIR